MTFGGWPVILQRWRRRAERFLRRPGFATAPSGPRPERLEVDKWAMSETVLKLIRIVGTHPYPLDELLLMAAAFAYHRPEVVIDIGTHVGKSARIWHELSRELGTKTSIHTIDLCDASHPEFPAEQLGRYVRGLPVTQHVGDGVAVATGLIERAPSAVYLIFCDGDHRRESVARELELATAVRRGCLLVHDTFYQPGSTYNHGPYEAMNEFISRVPVRQVLHLQTGLPGLSYLGLSSGGADPP
ncbi:MAG TPA: class I SAM-dependent methyltransferase [Nitrospiria bacterium]|nr:class I SAM-dependent methyltransferase [Nitrospiria bacterium]